MNARIVRSAQAKGMKLGIRKFFSNIVLVGIIGAALFILALFPVRAHAIATLNFSHPVTILGNATVVGAVDKGGGSFVIDHPLDPANKLLFHSFVESPDVKNIYDGIATLDENGEAVVSLPPYFEALNKDFRYQVRPIEKPMPNLFIKQEVSGNSFVIGGGVPGGTVSWEVTGIRHDPYIEAYPVVTEVKKGPGALVGKGKYIYSEGYGSRGLTCTSFWGCVASFLRWPI
jgi:hypothetical protein